MNKQYEPPHDKPNKMTVRPAKTQLSLGIRPVCSESSLSAHDLSLDGRTLTLLVLSCRDSYVHKALFPNVCYPGGSGTAR